MIDVRIDILKPILDVIEAYTGIQCIYMDQNKGHRPKKDYITAKVSNIETPDYDDISNIDETTNQITVKSDREFTVLIKIVGDNAMSIGNQIHDLYSNEEATIINDVQVWENGNAFLYFIDRGDVISLSPLREYKIEPEARIELRFRSAIISTFESSYFEKVSIGSTLIVGDKQKIINFTIQK